MQAFVYFFPLQLQVTVVLQLQRIIVQQHLLMYLSDSHIRVTTLPVKLML